MKTMVRALLAMFLFAILASAEAGFPQTDSQGQALPSLAPMLKKTNPAVVNIATYYTRVEQYRSRNPFFNDPFFREFFGVPERRGKPQKRQNSAGSGVIVDAERGLVLTNAHVIKGAEEVEVSLVDGRTLNAKIRGSDPELDIAVLEIEAEELTALPLADSDQLLVGDFVVAIGNPFGLGQTVTTGIVSALGRSGLGIEGYENFIQTDASINPGNSGGALVNLRGELVGINTAIIAPAGGNVGIGFAIPVNMALVSMEQLVEDGKVTRTEIGVAVQEITPKLRPAFGLKRGQHGVAISEVVEDSPAEQGGVQEGDVVLAVNGQPTRSSDQLRSQIGVRRVGETIRLTIVRAGRSQELQVVVSAPRLETASLGELNRLLVGMELAEHPKHGLYVSELDEDSPAYDAGIEVGDRIVQLNRHRVRSERDFREIAAAADSLLIYLKRRGRGYYTIIE